MGSMKVSSPSPSVKKARNTIEFKKELVAKSHTAVVTADDTEPVIFHRSGGSREPATSEWHTTTLTIPADQIRASGASETCINYEPADVGNVDPEASQQRLQIYLGLLKSNLGTNSWGSRAPSPRQGAPSREILDSNPGIANITTFRSNFNRLQFPVRLAFAMTISKAQGQSLRVAGINLEQPCFSHGQLYVACSRVGSLERLFILSPEEKTKNIDYQKALRQTKAISAPIGCPEFTTHRENPDWGVAYQGIFQKEQGPSSSPSEPPQN
ncbi:uncharacterized protein LOC135218889 [Macrobrachium nipponense]|uniref:uncharacterized protein LOC135218889 n=1 Tax=Macrobrachium nipponense TaxID=159736 RepID=UPI0030C87B8A